MTKSPPVRDIKKDNAWLKILSGLEMQSTQASVEESISFREATGLDYEFTVGHGSQLTGMPAPCLRLLSI